MYKPFCLIGLLALAGCAGSSAPPTTATTSTAGGTTFTLNVPNMT